MSLIKQILEVVKSFRSRSTSFTAPGGPGGGGAALWIGARRRDGTQRFYLLQSRKRPSFEKL
ncbi:hypothetical protein K7432_009606 [Basidiobolus ranarum]|uniref:Uncharacterized protein n=1 Tax=Basidiobolus ranarum TaxID=34480 RepID=A0ABR2WQ35_9FUNG